MAAGTQVAVLIYALKDPASGEVRYVGKTNDVAKRLREHLGEARIASKQTYKVRWIRSLTEPPIVEVLEVIVDSADWVERERYWIAKYRSEGARLTNHTDGGDGWRRLGGHSEETKAKLREQALARGAKPPSQKGRKASAETRAKLSAVRKALGTTPPPTGGWNKGMKMPAEIVEKNRLSHPKGEPWTEARRAAQKPLTPEEVARRRTRQREQRRDWRKRNREYISAYKRKYNASKKVG